MGLFKTRGIVASACMKQRTTKLSIQADRSTGFNQQAGLLMAARNTMRGYGQAGFWLLLFSLLMLPMMVQAVPAGTVINNTATATYNGGVTDTSNNNNNRDRQNTFDDRIPAIRTSFRCSTECSCQYHVL